MELSIPNHSTVVLVATGCALELIPAVLVMRVHVSVFSQLVCGPYDDNLTWPFLGTVTVELLNQLADANHHSMVIPFLTIHKTRIGSTWGYDKFFSHDELFHDSSSNTQYLMNDSLYFRVTVEVDNHKPWLDCTHHIK